MTNTSQPTKTTLEWFNCRRRHEQMRVQVISDDAEIRVNLPCEQGDSGIREAFTSLPLPKGTVLLAGTHNEWAYEWDWYDFTLFLADRNNEQEGILGKVQRKHLQIIEVIE